MIKLIGEDATLEFAAKLASVCQPSLIIHLQGDLGSGKTTFARGFIKRLGHSGNVKSPTFTLVEPYELERMHLYHFDLYRLNDPQELEYLGIRDLFGEQGVICLIEWPERGGDELPSPDIEIQFQYQDDARGVDLQAKSTKGQSIIDKL
ncbi:MAG: tRNA (adenosine(37)-N6)-threonylcarbamoyltransferase complex ATPase subunit type 1 TsaE [Gammaproteobacteria bacterium]